MNKFQYVFYYAFLLFLGSILFSCNNLEKGSKGKSYSDYKDACADGEFGVARLLVEKKGLARDRYEYFYVYDKESVYLAGMNEEQATQRLLFLIKEEKTATENDYHYQQDWLSPQIGKLMSLAVTLENIKLIRGIYKMCSGDIKLAPGVDVIEFMAKQGTEEDNQLVILHDGARYGKGWLKSIDVMNHIDIALRMNNVALAKGLVNILKPEDKSIANKKYKILK